MLHFPGGRQWGTILSSRRLLPTSCPPRSPHTMEAHCFKACRGLFLNVWTLLWGFIWLVQCDLERARGPEMGILATGVVLLLFTVPIHTLEAGCHYSGSAVLDICLLPTSDLKTRNLSGKELLHQSVRSLVIWKQEERNSLWLGLETKESVTR